MFQIAEYACGFKESIPGWDLFVGFVPLLLNYLKLTKTGGERRNNRLFSVYCSSFEDKAYLFHPCFRDHFQYM